MRRPAAENDRAAGAELEAPGCGSTGREEPGSWIVRPFQVECGGEAAKTTEASFGRVLFLFCSQTASPGRRKSWRLAWEPCTLQEEAVEEQEVADEDEGC